MEIVVVAGTLASNLFAWNGALEKGERERCKKTKKTFFSQSVWVRPEKFRRKVFSKSTSSKHLMLEDCSQRLNISYTVQHLTAQMMIMLV